MRSWSRPLRPRSPARHLRGPSENRPRPERQNGGRRGRAAPLARRWRPNLSQGLLCAASASFSRQRFALVSGTGLEPTSASATKRIFATARSPAPVSFSTYAARRAVSARETEARSAPLQGVGSGPPGSARVPTDAPQRDRHRPALLRPSRSITRVFRAGRGALHPSCAPRELDEFDTAIVGLHRSKFDQPVAREAHIPSPSRAVRATALGQTSSSRSNASSIRWPRRQGTCVA